jgi:hypothetical protein
MTSTRNLIPPESSSSSDTQRSRRTTPIDISLHTNLNLNLSAFSHSISQTPNYSLGLSLDPSNAQSCIELPLLFKCQLSIHDW